MTYERGLGGSLDTAASLFEQYGATTARGMVAGVRRAPPELRGPLMKEAMTRIDKTLSARAERNALELASQGMSKAEALERGIAKAITEGMVAELADLGSKRQAPKPGSLLGLGATTLRLSLPTTTATSLRPPAPTAPAGGKMVEVGPFTFPVADKPFLLVDGLKAMEAIPRSWHGYIRRALVITPAEVQALIASMTSSGALTTVVAFAKLQMQKAPTNTVWQKGLHVLPGETVTMRAISPMMTMGKWSDDDDGRAMPIATFTHPVTKNKWGVFLSLLGGKTNPYSVQLYVKWLPERPWYSRALSWIADLPSKIVDAVSDVVDFVKKQTCKVLTAAAPAMAAAGTSAGASPQTQAIAGGAVIGATLCAPPAPPPPPAITGGGLLLPLLLIGGAGVAIYALTSR